MRSWLVVLAFAAGACTVLNSYESVPDPSSGGGGAGGEEPAGAGGLGGSGGGGGGTGGEGGLPACNDAACDVNSTECQICECVQDVVCDCNPVAAGTPCATGVCLDAICVECLTNADCNGTACEQNVCIAASCTDMVQNSGETDVDCGGPNCARCQNGQTCVVDFDCVSLFCAAPGVCGPCLQQSDCSDPNLYCGPGGMCVQKKGPLQACSQDYECLSGNCQNGVLCGS